MEDELLYSVALSRLQGIGPVYAKRLLRHFGEARDIFHAGIIALREAVIPDQMAQAILAFQDFSSLEKEIAHLSRKGIRILLFTDPAFPQRLLPIEQAPFLLYCKGEMDWNAQKILGVIGTRKPSEFGRHMTDQLIRHLAAPDLVILSGLASGIDGAAHRAALKYGLPTIGVMAHGFRHVYPPQNADLFRAMQSHGGLITEFAYDIRPGKYQFPTRNRIVAGMSDAILVVETTSKGGSLDTIKKALDHGKKVFAVPGRLTDPKSAGCNQLIAKGYARLLFGAYQLKAEMKWDTPNPAILGPNPAASSATLTTSTETTTRGAISAPTTPSTTQPFLFHSDAGLSQPEGTLLKLLRDKGILSLDELACDTGISTSALAILLLRLELQDLVTVLPGNRYRPSI